MKSTLNNFFSIMLGATLILLVVSCGYKLRAIEDYSQNATLTIFFSDSSLNNNFIDLLKRSYKPSNIYLNKSSDNPDLILRIIDHSINRYSAAIGSGARTKEARLEYLLVIGLKNSYMNEEKVYEIKKTKNYSFDESNILALEEEEKQITNNFIIYSIKKIRLISSKNFKE